MNRLHRPCHIDGESLVSKVVRSQRWHALRHRAVHPPYRLLRRGVGDDSIAHFGVGRAVAASNDDEILPSVAAVDGQMCKRAPIAVDLAALDYADLARPDVRSSFSRLSAQLWAGQRLYKLGNAG